MDPAHVAYVHTSRWFRAKTRHVTEKTKSFEPKGLGFKMAQHRVPPTQTFYKVLGKEVTADITYLLPGIRIEEIHGDRHQVVGLTALTPITDEETMFHQMFWTTMAWTRPLRPLVRKLSLIFLEPGPRRRSEAAGRAPVRPEDDADQRRQYAAALVDASEGRMGGGRPRGPSLRQSAEAEDAALDELSDDQP